MPPGTMASLANKLAALLFFFAVSLRGQVGPAAEAGPVRLDFSGPGMGTTFRIALYTTPEKKILAATAVESAFQRLASLNAIFSDYEPNSEINRLATTAPTPWTASPDLLALTTLSLKFASDTHGAFDPTIGQLSRLWRSTRQRQKLAPPDRLQKALSSIGWQHLQIRNNTLNLTQPGLLLDFGGVAKGYAADQMLAILKDKGFPIALVQAGGDTAAGDAPANQSGWPITLLTEPNDPSPSIVTLANRSVSTSGDLHQFIELDGIRYSHIINPQTGLGLTRRIACSVIAPHTTTSDALATALCILGPEKGRPIARNLKLTVRWTWQDKAGAQHQAWFNP
ncbi:MAG: FAD:protein FMN transferase [Verrucomicrobiaceae bacterium]|nr:FAD:protein FMN transferase [Verrucomicrobiaceae bacterium]